MATEKSKYPIESTELSYVELERALLKAKDYMGWKGLTAFLVTWTNKNQPADTNYSLPWWVKEIFKHKALWKELKKEFSDSATIVKLIKNR